MLRHPMRSLATLLAALLLWTGAGDPVHASTRGVDLRSAARIPGVSVTMVSAPDLTLDSNAPCTGPQTTYVSFRVTNTAGTTQTNLSATLGGFSGGITLAGGQAATQYVGYLNPGASRYVYWLVTYPCSFGVSTSLTVSVTDSSGGSVTGSGTVTTKSMISAQAGGVLTPPSTLGPGAVVGQTISLDVTYDFGAADIGTTYDLQPVGNTSFNAACFQMVGSQVTTSNILAIPVGSPNQQYFTSSAKQTGNGQQATIRYFFKYLCAGVTSTARPYSNQLSGTQLKYSSNYQTFVGPALPSATIGFTISKSASPTLLPTGGTATYTVTVNNTSSFTAEVDSIADVLPAGAVYQGIAAGSGVTALNSGSVPATSSTGTLKWRGPYSVAPGASLTLVYTVTIPAAAGSYVNTASGYAGITSVGTASATVKTGVVRGVDVTPKGLAQAIRRLPGTGYSQVYTVNDTSNVTDDFDLLARVTGAGGIFVAVDSITGSGITTRPRPDSVRLSLTPASTGSYTVWYRVLAGASAEDTLYLKARSATQSSAQSEGWAQIRRVSPSLAISKAVSPNTQSPPGTDLTYTLQFGNVGDYDARGVTLVEQIPTQMALKVGSLQETLPSGITVAVTYSSDGGTNWTYTPTSGGCGAPSGYDGCAQRIRWTVQGDFPPNSSTAGTLRFVARIR